MGQPLGGIYGSDALAPDPRAAHSIGMVQTPHILLIAGSFEARGVAEALSARGLSYDAWLSEAPRGAAPMPQIPRLMQYADAAALHTAVAAGGFTAVLDAGHAFDRGVTAQVWAAARALRLPYLRLERPAWLAEGRPNLHTVADVAAANAMIPDGARVFCTTGWDSLTEYAGFRGAVLMLRQTRRHARPAPYPFVELVFDDPPFAVAQERAKFTALSVDMLVCRNLGGQASRTKVDAALALGLEVILVDRPAAPPDLPRVADVDAALEWVWRL